MPKVQINRYRRFSERLCPLTHLVQLRSDLHKQQQQRGLLEGNLQLLQGIRGIVYRRETNAVNSDLQTKGSPKEEISEGT